MPDPKPVPVPKPKRTRNVSLVLIYQRDMENRLIKTDPSIFGPHNDAAKAKAALRKWIGENSKGTPPATFLLVRIIEEITPKVESVTKVTL